MVRKALFGSHPFDANTIDLPRQARDKHEKTSADEKRTRKTFPAVENEKVHDDESGKENVGGRITYLLRGIYMQHL